MSEWRVIDPEDKWTVVQPESKGWSGVGRDILSGALAVPGAIYDIAKEAPGEIYGAGNQVFTDPVRVAQNVGQGLVNFGEGANNLYPNIRDYLRRKEITKQTSPDILNRQEHIDIGELTGRGPQKPGDALIAAMSEYFLPGTGGKLGTLGKSGARKTAQMAAAIGTHEAGQNRNPITGAFIPGALELGFKGGKAGFKAARNPKQAFNRAMEVPSDIAANIASKFGPELSPAELQEQLRLAEGTQTHLGEVIKSPTLKKHFENTLAPMFGSGADEIFSNIADDLNKRGENIVSRMSENPANSDPNLIMKDLLTEGYESSKKIKNNLWNTTSEIAQNEGFNLTLPSFDKYISKNRKIIESSPLIKNDPTVKQTYKNLSRYSENVERIPEQNITSSIIGPNGEPIISETIPEQVKYPSIKEAKWLANKFDTEASKLENSSASADRSMYGLYKSMAEKLRTDTNNAVNERGSSKLKSEYDRANKYYSDTFANFLDKDVFPLTRENKSGQSIIREIIKPGKHDKYEAIQKVNDLLPENQQEIMGFSYLLDAFDKEGNINPNKLNKLVKALGQRQFDSLFKPETRQSLLDFDKLTHMNKEAISRMFNPKTGARGSQAYQIIANIFAAAAGGSVGGVAGSFIGPAAMSVLSNMLTKAATSESFRNKVIAKKIKSASRKVSEAEND